eukprot:5002654-Amphidinium_carterae.1
MEHTWVRNGVIDSCVRHVLAVLVELNVRVMHDGLKKETSTITYDVAMLEAMCDKLLAPRLPSEVVLQPPTI